MPRCWRDGSCTCKCSTAMRVSCPEKSGPELRNYPGRCPTDGRYIDTAGAWSEPEPGNDAMTRVIDTYELSPMQAGMLFHAVSGVDRGVDLEQMVATLHEPLEEAPFLRAWQRVVERHAVLRSRYRWESVAEPVKEVLDRVEIPVERLDWRALAEAERRERFQALLGDDRTRGFELDQAPLMRLALVRAGEREHWALWTFHHALLDGRSWGLLLREIFAFYDGLSR